MFGSPYSYNIRSLIPVNTGTAEHALGSLLLVLLLNVGPALFMCLFHASAVPSPASVSYVNRSKLDTSVRSLNAQPSLEREMESDKL